MFQNKQQTNSSKYILQRTHLKGSRCSTTVILHATDRAKRTRTDFGKIENPCSDCPFHDQTWIIRTWSVWAKLNQLLSLRRGLSELEMISLWWFLLGINPASIISFCIFHYSLEYTWSILIQWWLINMSHTARLKS